MASTTTAVAMGVISPSELYTLTAFKNRLGISNATLRTARRAGLPVRYLHRQGFIYGQDWINYVLNSDNSGEDVSATMNRQPSA